MITTDPYIKQQTSQCYNKLHNRAKIVNYSIKVMRDGRGQHLRSVGPRALKLLQRLHVHILAMSTIRESGTARA